MMRGRRKGRVNRRPVRSAASDDQPSDSPKRKDSKLEFQGRLSHASPRITNFFQPQTEKSATEVEDSENPVAEIATDSVTDSNLSSVVAEELNLMPESKSPSPDFSDDAAELNEQVKSTETPSQETATPNSENSDNPKTPHKMILVSKTTILSPSSALSQLTLANGSLKKAQKSRRRLNPSQTSNQIAAVSAGSGNKSKNPTAAGNQPSVTAAVAESQHKLTEYFPVRRSVRKTKQTVLEEQQRTLEEAVLSRKEDGLEIHNFEGKGRGIVANKSFSKGEFVVEYAGELIQMDTAKEREKIYAQDQNTGCYMYYFKHKNVQYCVDATPESDRLGRLVNHSRNGNLMTKTILVGEQPRLVLIAKEDIQCGEEVTYDYGDRSKESLRYHPWLAS